MEGAGEFKFKLKLKKGGRNDGIRPRPGPRVI